MDEDCSLMLAIRELPSFSVVSQILPEKCPPTLEVKWSVCFFDNYIGY